MNFDEEPSRPELDAFRRMPEADPIEDDPEYLDALLGGAFDPEPDVSGVHPGRAAIDDDGAPAERSTWWPVHGGADRDPPPPPAVLAREDGPCLFYRGKQNVLAAETESGKSWAALLTSKQILDAGGTVYYLDFEDSRSGVTERLLGMGVDPEVLATRFLYVNPDDPLRHGDKVTDAGLDYVMALELLGPDDLVVLDGTTEALGLHSHSSRSEDDYVAYHRLIVRPVLKRGITMVTIDHVTKDKETRNGFAAGTQHKKALVDGAQFELETVKSFGRGKHGHSKVFCSKDRPGHVRALGTGQGKGRMDLVAELHVDDTGDCLSVRLLEPAGQAVVSGQPTNFRPTTIMESVSEALTGVTEGLSLSALRRMVKGTKSEHKDAAINLLVAEGFVRRTKVGQASMHHLERPYVATSDPLSDTYSPPHAPPAVAFPEITEEF